MKCSNCGTENPANATHCSNCNVQLRQVVYAQSAPPKIPNYLVQAILVTLLCCLPTGIVAIVYAAQVDTKLKLNDVQGAMQSSKNAKMWSWISFGLGAVVLLIYVLFFVLAFVLEDASPS